MALHKFILENNSEGTAFLWYSKDGTLFPVAVFSPEEQEDEGYFEDLVAETAVEWYQKNG